MARRLFYVCAREACSDVFARRPRDAARAKRPLCSTHCRDMEAKTGRLTVRLRCGRPGCDTLFDRIPGYVRYGNVYCSKACYHLVVDRRALGRKGGLMSRPPAVEVRQARSRLGGIARARSQSKERLREIALLGVAARMKKLTPVQRSLIARRALRKAVLTRYGKRSYFGVDVAPPSAARRARDG